MYKPIKNLEEIEIWPGKIRGKTFGCGCCSESVEIPPEHLKDAAMQLAKMYAETANYYKKMAEAVDIWGVEKIAGALYCGYDPTPTQKNILSFLGLLPWNKVPDGTK